MHWTVPSGKSTSAIAECGPGCDDGVVGDTGAAVFVGDAGAGVWVLGGATVVGGAGADDMCCVHAGAAGAKTASNKIHRSRRGCMGVAFTHLSDNRRLRPETQPSNCLLVTSPRKRGDPQVL